MSTIAAGELDPTYKGRQVSFDNPRSSNRIEGTFIEALPLCVDGRVTVVTRSSNAYKAWHYLAQNALVTLEDELCGEGPRDALCSRIVTNGSCPTHGRVGQ